MLGRVHEGGVIRVVESVRNCARVQGRRCSEGQGGCGGEYEAGVIQAYRD